MDAPIYVRWSSQENEELVLWESVDRPYSDFLENPECLYCEVVCNLEFVEVDSIDLDDLRETFIENFSEDAYEAWNPKTSTKRLNTFLEDDDSEEFSFALQNPSAPKDLVRDIANRQLAEWRNGTGAFKFLSNPCFWQTEPNAFRKRLAQHSLDHIQHRISSLGDDDLAQELKAYLHFYGYWIRNQAGFDDEENEFDHQTEIDDIFIEYWFSYEYYHFCASILKYGSDSAKKVFKKVDSITFEWLNYLFQRDLLEPYLYWIDENDHKQLLFNEYQFRRIGANSGYDHRAFIAQSGLPELFSPLILDEDPLALFNIESGQAVFFTSKKENTLADSQIGVAVSSGIGDGVYGAYPLFDNLGDLQMLVALFQNVHLDSEWISSNVFDGDEDRGIPYFRLHVPIPLGKIVCDGDFAITDFANLQYGNEKNKKVIVFENLPQDEYLIVGYLDCSATAGFGPANSWDGGIDLRCSAVAAVRGRARYLLERFFELFPTLEGERITSLVPGFVRIRGADLAQE